MKNNIIVVIPAYNAQSTIGHTITSVLSQENVDVMVIAVDHGSKDNTWKQIQKFCSQNPSVQGIHLTRTAQERRSASRPLNAGMQRAEQLAADREHTWVMRLDSDDTLCNKSVLSELMKSADDIKKLISGRIILVNSQTQTADYYSQSPKYDNLELLRKGAVYAYPHHATLIRVDLLNTVLKEDGYCCSEEIGYGEDMDFSLRLFRRCCNHEIAFTHIPIILKEQSGDTITNRISYRALMHDHFLIFRRNPELSRLLLLKIVVWFTLEHAGCIGKWLNQHRQPPAQLFMQIQAADYPEVIARRNHMSR